MGLYENEIRCYMSVLKWCLVDNKCSVSAFVSPTTPLPSLQNPVFLTPFPTCSWRTPTPCTPMPVISGRGTFWRRYCQMQVPSCISFSPAGHCSVTSTFKDAAFQGAQNLFSRAWQTWWSPQTTWCPPPSLPDGRPGPGAPRLSQLCSLSQSHMGPSWAACLKGLAEHLRELASDRSLWESLPFFSQTSLTFVLLGS